MKKRMHVTQSESNAGQYWYTVDRGNGQPMLTSETYSTRDQAVRGARRFIAAIDPVPVTFMYWAGTRPPFADATAAFSSNRRRVTERIR